MGCQNSRLSVISNQNHQTKPTPGDHEQNKKPKSKSKIYQCKQNINSQDGLSTHKEKENTPQTLSIITNDEAKIQAECATKQEIQMVAEAIAKIEEFQCTERKNRKSYQMKAKSKVDFQDYFDQIIRMLSKRKLIILKVVEQVKRKYATKLNKKAQPEDIDRLIKQYLNQNHVTYFEAKRWLKEKLVILRVKGDTLVKWIKEICSKWKTNKQMIPELLQVLIEDLIPTEKSYRMKIAFEYQYKNTLEQMSEWQTQMGDLYDKLAGLMV